MTTFRANYRPICSTPLLHKLKLLGRLLHNRLQPTLDAHQTPDQGGFRSGHSTTDHWNSFQDLRPRMAARPRRSVDLKNVSRAVEHNSMWKALHARNIQLGYSSTPASPPTFTRTLKKRPFFVQCGTKQGDPISSPHFNALLQHITASASTTQTSAHLGTFVVSTACYSSHQLSHVSRRCSTTSLRRRQPTDSNYKPKRLKPTHRESLVAWSKLSS